MNNRNVTAVILIVLAVGVYFTITNKVWDEVAAIKSVNDEYASAIGNADRLIKVRDQVLQNFNNISETDRNRLEKMLPSTVDNIRLVIDLNSVAMSHGFTLKNIKATVSANPGKSPAPNVPASSPVPSANNTQGKLPAQGDSLIPTPTLDTVSVSFGVGAPYQQFISFLQDLEANLRIMDLSRLTIAVNDSGTYDFNLEFKTYWLRQQ